MDTSSTLPPSIFTLQQLQDLVFRNAPSYPSFSSPMPSYSSPLQFKDDGESEAKQIEYRSHKIAAFEINKQTMICLPQGYELFLKNHVGGLHTVYTKLKRLGIRPQICNVEQVRALRSMGAINPGVNRCKLISCNDFDILFDDCTTASARPGRPPKRSPPVFPTISSDVIKKPRLSDPWNEGIGNGDGMNMAGILPFLNPFNAQQMLMTQMINAMPNNQQQHIDTNDSEPTANPLNLTKKEVVKEDEDINEEHRDDDIDSNSSASASKPEENQQTESVTSESNSAVERLLLNIKVMIEATISTIHHQNIHRGQVGDELELAKSEMVTLEKLLRTQQKCNKMLKKKLRSERRTTSTLRYQIKCMNSS